MRAGIAIAKAQGSEQIGPDHLLLGCLLSLSRFGVAVLGNWSIDLEPFGINWRKGADVSGAKPSYSDEVVAILDTAATIAALDGVKKVEIPHLLACFSDEGRGVMGELRKHYGVTSAGWRAALGQIETPPESPASPATVTGRPFLTPEEAAAYLGVHIQTLRGYIRSNKLPALRIAGERAIRLRREDLDSLLEPIEAQEAEKQN